MSKQDYRRNIRLKGHDYSQSGLYFVRICTIHHVKLREFIVMPNPIHGIVEIVHVMKTTLATMVGSYKSAVSKHVHPIGYVEFAWQRNYHEHIIRNAQSCQHIAQYITNKPVTWEKDRQGLLDQD